MDWQGVPGWAIAFAASFCACGIMVLFGPKDAPTSARKEQKRPVPTAGGIGIAAAFFSVLVLQSLTASYEWPVAYYVNVALMVGFLLVGFIDDIADMGSVVKMIALGVLSVAACIAGWQFLFGGQTGVWGFAGVSALIGGGALWIFVFANAANFMDGSNGLSLGSMVIMLCVLSALGSGSPPLIFAVLAFLVWNLADRLYAGDAGALFVGYSVAGAALQAAYLGNFSIWIPPLIALPFLTDVILTVIWRARRGENILHAHNQHAYHLFKRVGWGHWPVALLWWVMTAACGTVAVLAVETVDTRGQFAAFAGMLAVSIGLWVWQRRVYWPRVSALG
ncbi:MAG: hypothetical protein AAF829_07185 [Pseudomonadota bacterium]